MSENHDAHHHHRKATDQKVQNYFLMGILLLSFFLVFLLFRPYVAALLLAVVLTVIFRPMQEKLMKWFKGPGWAAAISTVVVIVIILAPIFFFLGVAVKELLLFISSGQASDILHRATFLNRFGIDATSYAEGFLSNTFNNLGAVLGNVIAVFAFIGITVITMFFFFKDGPQLRDSILDALPLSDERAGKLKTDLDIGIKAVIGGYVLVALLQGAVSGIGYWIFGVPQPALWAMVTVIAALIPSFGASVIYIVAALLLFGQHDIGAGIGLVCWWILAVTFIDNVVGPKFISGRSQINIVLLLFSILGGLKLFGPAGFIIGPVIIIFFWSVLGMFQESGMLPNMAAPKNDHLKL